MYDAPDLALTRDLLNEKVVRLRRCERTLFQSLVAFDVFVGPQLLAGFLGLAPDRVGASLSKLKRAGLVRSTPAGEVGITYRVLRDILPGEWRRPGPVDALRMASLLLDSRDWYAIGRRAELCVLAGELTVAVREFERAGIEAQHGEHFKEAARYYALAVTTAKAAMNEPSYTRDESEDEDGLERTAARCRSRAKSVRLKL
jgi:hypothetical protein